MPDKCLSTEQAEWCEECRYWRQKVCPIQGIQSKLGLIL